MANPFRVAVIHREKQLVNDLLGIMFCVMASLNYPVKQFPTRAQFLSLGRQCKSSINKVA
jgi:hypothetical protein